MTAPVLFFEVTGSDGPRLQRFYTDLFDWKVDDANAMRYGFVQAPDGGMPGGIGQTPDGSIGHATFYVGTPDVTAALDRAQSLGGRAIMPRTAVDENIVVGLMADPDGHVVGLIERP